MTRKTLFAGFLVLVFAVAALAADQISGKWVWESRGFGFGGGGAGIKTTLTLKAEGTKLTGTITLPSFGGGPPDPNTPPQMEEVPISNGKIEGNNISFEVAREMMGMTRTTKYEGVLSGGELKIKIIQQEVTAKKQ